MSKVSQKGFSGFFARIGLSLPMRPTVPQSHVPNKAALNGLAIMIGGALFWHFTIAQPAIAIYSFVPLLLKLYLLRRAAKMPRAKHAQAPARWIMALLTVFSIAMILLFYGGWNGQVAGISFIVLLISLKFLESRELRDYFVVCIILYFLAACAFLFDSSILSIVMVSIYVIGITTTLHLLSTPNEALEDTDVRQYAKSSLQLLSMAIPLAIILFFFFPRIQGDFGFLPSQDEGQSNQALDDRLIAGDMALAAFDNSLAFRAQFDGTPPSPFERYWRVKVLDKEIDFQWELASDQFWQFDGNIIEGQKDALTASDFNYTIIHQESSDRYLPYLDYVRGFSDGVLLKNTVIKIPEADSGVFAYRGSASRQRFYNMDSNDVDERFLQTTSQPSSRMQTQLQQWRELAANTAVTESEINRILVQQLMQHFGQDPFSYTLLPPVLQEGRELEDFFFNTRSGYCEHYASAFTTLARWLDVPARVVVGYQGGELNSAGSFIEVRYSDAHAWSEVWLDGEWVRFDPTAMISPDRIEFGMQALMEMWDGIGFSQDRRGLALANFLNPRGVSAAYRYLRQSWSNVSFQWNKWVVNYDQNAQRELLDALGLQGSKTLSSLILIMIGGIGMLVLVPLIFAWLRKPKPAPEQIVFDKLIRKLSNKGISYQKNMTARDLLELYGGQSPSSLQKQELEQIVARYETIRYGKTSKREQHSLTKELRHMVRAFKPRHSS